MKLASMQPYFFPYLGYFSLIKHTDIFIINSSVQFITQGWIERNRVLKQNEGWLYIRVPLIKQSHKSMIEDVKIDNKQDWKQKILMQLRHYKRIAQFYNDTIHLLNELFENDFEDIASLNKKSLESVCRYLNFEKKINLFSEMKLSIESPKASDEWGLNICKAVDGVTEFWNPPGGLDFYDKSKYDNGGIGLKFQKIKLTPYDQKRGNFEPGLSIIDVMMFNNPEEINKMLDDFELL
jgi:hypothetical protein